MTPSRQNRRAVRPAAEFLETRQLLSGSVRGLDVDGDRWSIRLVGPGDLRVTSQLTTATRGTLIDEITMSGTDPLHTRLIGTVRKGPNGDGRVFFAQMNQLGGQSIEFSGANLGIKAIDMPHFYLGQTSTQANATDPTINIPFGVMTLRLGGADVNFTPPGGTPLNQNGQSDSFTVNLGTPFSYGTSIVVDQVVTNAQAGVGTAAATQDSVTFNVTGRLNVFQANRIEGNEVFPATGFQAGGGTIVRVLPDQERSLPGPIGFSRVGGDATNFTVQTSERISNFYIGGETSGVSLLAVGNARDIGFGRGMDDVTIRAAEIETLQANRGAVGSQVVSTGRIGRVTIGGDVVNTIVQAGYDQDLASAFQTQQAPDTISARSVGTINNVLIGGDVVDSIFAASVEPFGDQFDVPQALLFPHSFINAKVEGRISNENVTPNKPDQAFYAKEVAVARGPVNPPNIPEPPFPRPLAPPSGKRIVDGLQSNRQRQVRQDATPTAVGRLMLPGADTLNMPPDLLDRA